MLEWLYIDSIVGQQSLRRHYIYLDSISSSNFFRIQKVLAQCTNGWIQYFRGNHDVWGFSVFHSMYYFQFLCTYNIHISLYFWNEYLQYRVHGWGVTFWKYILGLLCEIRALHKFICRCNIRETPSCNND